MKCARFKFGIGTLARNGTVFVIAVAAAAWLWFDRSVQPVKTRPSSRDVRGTRNAERGLRNAERSVAGSASTLTLQSSSTTDDEQRTTDNDDRPHDAQGVEALRLHLATLEKGYQRLLEIPAYTATLFKQERIDGSLKDGQMMQLKLRHQPFSVYLKWLVGDVGKEVLFVEGEHDDQLLVKFGGWKARMIPTFKLDPNGSVARSESRYPIREVGIMPILTTLLDHRRHDLATTPQLTCELVADDTYGNRPCFRFTIEYGERQGWNEYRKSTVYIDRDLLLPVCIRNFVWLASAAPVDPVQLDELTLVEHYEFRDLCVEPAISPADFESGNQEYRFER